MEEQRTEVQLREKNVERREKELELKEKQSKSVILVNFYTITVTLFNYMHCNLQGVVDNEVEDNEVGDNEVEETQGKLVSDCDAYTFIVNC